MPSARSSPRRCVHGTTRHRDARYRAASAGQPRRAADHRRRARRSRPHTRGSFLRPTGLLTVPPVRAHGGGARRRPAALWMRAHRSPPRARLRARAHACVSPAPTLQWSVCVPTRAPRRMGCLWPYRGTPTHALPGHPDACPTRAPRRMGSGWSIDSGGGGVVTVVSKMKMKIN